MSVYEERKLHTASHAADIAPACEGRIGKILLDPSSDLLKPGVEARSVRNRIDADFAAPLLGRRRSHFIGLQVSRCTESGEESDPDKSKDPGTPHGFARMVTPMTK